MKKFLFHVEPEIFNIGRNQQLISPKRIILCTLVALLCLVSASYAADGLVGKWRAVDQDNIIYGFSFLPELKFTEDGTLYAGLHYGYKIIDDGKFLWQMGNGIERVYKYEISGNILMIYSLQAPRDRARFKRVE